MKQRKGMESKSEMGDNGTGYGTNVSRNVQVTKKICNILCSAIEQCAIDVTLCMKSSVG